MFFEISSLEGSGKTLDIWFIKTDFVSHQELSSACWYLMFLNIKVCLRHLFFLDTISNSLFVSNSLLIFSLCSFIWNFKLYHITVIASISFFCFLFYLFHLDVYLSRGGVDLLLGWSKFPTEIIKLSLRSALISSKLLFLLLLELLSFPLPDITNLN